MGKTAETVIVRSFAYFSRFPPQFSPCENCAPIVQTTLWNYIRPCSASPYRTSFFTYITLDPLSTAAETSAVLSFAYFSQFPPQFSPRKLRTHCSNNAMEFYIPCSAPPYRTSFSTYIIFAPLSTAAETSAVLSFAYLSQFPPQFSPCENCLTVRSNNAMELHLPLFRLLLTEQVFYLHYARSSIHSG